MRQTRVLIVGKSALSLLVARELDRTLANRTETDVVYITNEPALTPSTNLTSVLKLPRPIKKKPLLPHIKVVAGQIRHINLAEKIVVGESGNSAYDYLFLDQLPSYSVAELIELRGNFKTLLAEVKRMEYQDAQLTVRAAFYGSDTASLQLALALAADRDREGTTLGSRLKVAVNYRDSLSEFLGKEGVDKLDDQKMPGLKIMPPRSFISNLKIKGLAVDNKGRAITDSSLMARGNRWVTICDGPKWDNYNMGLGYAEVARKIAQNLVRQVEEEKIEPVEMLARGYLLRGRSTALLKWGRTVSSRLRAKMAIAGERQLWKRLVQID